MYQTSNFAASAPSAASTPPCAVRLGKILLHSMALDEIFATSSHGLKHVVTVNAEIFVRAHENVALEAILKETANTIDGRIVHYLCSLLYPGRRLQKLSGSDFIYNLADYAMRHEQRMYLLGAEQLSNRGAIQALKLRYSGLVIDGYSPSYCENIGEKTWNDEIISQIAGFRPTHLVVCFGPLKQEMWIAQNAHRLLQLGVRCAYGLGGSLDFVSGRTKRAPKWVQSVGVEWLFRVIFEPRRFARTAKMFKMPYFAIRFYNREVRVPRNLESLDEASDLKSV
jgi:N-acetylglucosaminyldiphosphoundecaprenol N-acetyl-beta-D-mannosaminyltransferase